MARPPQPLLVNNHVVTVWRYEDPVGSVPTGEDLGELVNHLRTVDVTGVELPRWDPVRADRSRIAEAEDVGQDDIAFLSGECDDIEERLPGSSTPCPSRRCTATHTSATSSRPPVGRCGATSTAAAWDRRSGTSSRPRWARSGSPAPTRSTFSWRGPVVST
ncbi:hypothetical protein GCM10029964_056330 [Kibdelosporangium lantanae]